jgi:type II secretion system protein G
MSKKGFTILEILVVLSVIAILIGVAVPRLKGMQDQANINKAKAELKTMQSALESYYSNASPNAYPTTTTTLGTTLAAATPQILPSALSDPFAAAGTQYNFMRNGNFYAIWSVGTAGDGSISAVNSSTGAVTKGGTAGSVVCITNGSGC